MPAGSPGAGRRFLWGLEERVVWGGADAVRATADVLRWPFERIAWAFEQHVVWPLQERGAALGAPARVGAGAVAAVLAIGAGGYAVTQLGEDGGSSPAAQAPVAEQVAQVEAVPEPAPEPEPVLQGATPDFTPPGAAPAEAGKVAGADAVASSEAAAGASAAGASATQAKGAAPGPGALQVVHRFADAFVLYETGRATKDVRLAFRETATPELATALLQRPPRQPAGAKVPKAKVVNVVPGPVENGVHTVSVSLLRVGLTTELRLDVERDPKTRRWQVTDVLG